MSPKQNLGSQFKVFDNFPHFRGSTSCVYVDSWEITDCQELFDEKYSTIYLHFSETVLGEQIMMNQEADWCQKEKSFDRKRRRYL